MLAKIDKEIDKETCISPYVNNWKLYIANNWKSYIALHKQLKNVLCAWLQVMYSKVPYRQVDRDEVTEEHANNEMDRRDGKWSDRMNREVYK